MLPEDLADKTVISITENLKIIGSALKGINENIKQLEKSADDANFIRPKGKYYEYKPSPRP